MPGDRPPPSDFTIARGIQDRALIEKIRTYLAQHEQQQVDLSRTNLEEGLDREVTKRDAECLFTGLVLCGAAEQESSGATFSDYSFVIDTRAAALVLRDQLVARAAFDAMATTDGSDTSDIVELAATFPPELEQMADVSVLAISDELRQLFFEAEESVRIANPYFDPDEKVVRDIAALAGRDVETRLLTRETDSGTRGLATTLNRIHGIIPESQRELFTVRDLFGRDAETGQQAFATHAKIAIADEELCYIGSANLTQTSLSSNFELGVILRGELATDAARIFDRVFALAREVDLPL